MKKAEKTRKPHSVLDVTEADYRREAAAGVPEEFRLKPGTHRFTAAGRVFSPHELNPRNTKVRITINIDLDVLNYFKRRAESPNAAPYQTQINNALREYVERSERKLEFSPLIENDDFIDALADRVEKRLVTRVRR